MKISKEIIEFGVLFLTLAILLVESLLGDSIGSGKALFLIVYLAPIFLIDFQRIRIDSIEIALIAFFVLYLLSSLVSGGGHKFALYIAIVGLFYRFGRVVSISNPYFNNILLACLVFAFVALFGYFFVDFGVPKNTVGASILYFLILAFWIKGKGTDFKKNVVLIPVFGFVALFLMDVRGASAQMLMLAIALYISSVIYVNRFKQITFFTVFILTMFAALTIVSYGDELEFFYVLEESMNSVSGRSIKSGRQLIWPISIEIISENPIWGLGAGFLINSLAGSETWSAHNTFLQVGMQVGWPGILLSLLMLYLVLKKIDEIHKSSRKKFVMMAIWFVIAFFNIFEVSLYQNAMPIAVLQWFILGLIVNPLYSDSVALGRKL